MIMVFCSVYGCSHRSQKVAGKVKFYRFPTINKSFSYTNDLIASRRALWLIRICRKDLDDEKVTRNEARVCSSHFVSGAPSKLADVDDPDWAPSLNLGHNYFDVNRKRKDECYRKGQCLCDADDGHEKCQRKSSKSSKKKIINNKTSSTNTAVSSMERIESETPISSSETIMSSFESKASHTSDTSSDPHIIPRQHDNASIITVSDSSNDSGEINLVPSESENSTSVQYFPSEDVHIRTIQSEGVSMTNLSSSEKTKLQEMVLISANAESMFIDDDNSKDMQENNSTENNVQFVQNTYRNSFAGPTNCSETENIHCVTNAEAFSAAKTLLHYLMNQNDVDYPDMNFILNLIRKIEKRLEKENISENS